MIRITTQAFIIDSLAENALVLSLPTMGLKKNRTISI